MSQQPIHCCQQLHAQRRLETIDNAAQALQYRLIGNRGFSRQVIRKVLAARIIEANAVHRTGVRQPLVAYQPGTIEGIEQVAQGLKTFGLAY